MYLQTTAALLVALFGVSQAVYYRRFVVTSPQANNVWLTGETAQITWRNITPAWVEWPTYSDINLRRSSDSSFSLNIAKNVLSADYNYNWTIPKSLANQDDYFISIQPIRVNWFGPDGQRLKPIVQANSLPYLIVGGKGDLNQLAFLQPTAGSKWFAGSTRYIQWTFEQATVDATITILLENPRWLETPLVVASQVSAIPGAANIVGFRWVVPTNLRSSTQYTLRIVAQWTGNSKPPVSSVGPQFAISNS